MASAKAVATSRKKFVEPKNVQKGSNVIKSSSLRNRVFYREIMLVSQQQSPREKIQQALWYTIALFGSLGSHIIRCLAKIVGQAATKKTYNKVILRHLIKAIIFAEQYKGLMVYLLVVIAMTHFIFGIKMQELHRELASTAVITIVAATVVLQSAMQIKVIHAGLIWFVVSTTSVIFNDCAAFIFGTKYGKTRLINVSPKKTVEGFVGALLTTIIWAPVVGELLSHISFLTYQDLPYSGTPLWLGKLENYTVPIKFTLKPFKVFGLTLYYRPAWVDFFVLGLFASLIAPLGGFFASVFKRWLKVKDFSELIPGHGGLTDRFDCQCIMAIITWLYIRPTMVQSSLYYILALINNLSQEDRDELFRLLQAENIDPVS